MIRIEIRSDMRLAHNDYCGLTVNTLSFSMPQHKTPTPEEVLGRVPSEHPLTPGLKRLLGTFHPQEPLPWGLNAKWHEQSTKLTYQLSICNTAGYCEG